MADIMKVNKKTYKKFRETERNLLAKWKKLNLSNKECASRLGRHPSTIGRELKKNSFKKDYYEALHAQHQSDKRKAKTYNSKQPLKNKDIYSYVLQKLGDGWSPEQIAGRLKIKYPKEAHWHICHETIYAFIYGPENKDKRLWEYLRRKQRNRKQVKGRKAHRIRIPDRISIHQRPKVVNKRKQIGHWEGDSIVGRGHKNGLHTEYERVSSITRLERLNSITAKETRQAMRKIFDPLPKRFKRSSTLDNGSEMILHKQSGIKCYFADPYSSWQRGGNENANLWIRYYFPKGTDFSTVSDQELKAVEWELNNRPRKRLQFNTPLEVLRKHLRGCARN